MPASHPELSIVIPAFNEEATIVDVLANLKKLRIRYDVIIVDDGSTDATVARIRDASDPAVRIISHDHNRGKGAALRTAFAHVTGSIVVIQDADGEYDPSDIPDLVRPIQSSRADAVFGSRLSGGKAQRAHLFWHKLGNQALSLLTGVLYNTTLSDMETGYKALSLSTLRRIEPLHENDFRIEAEITAKLCRGGFRIYEIPISYFGRSYSEGKKITWRDGFPAVFALVKYRFVRLR